MMPAAKMMDPVTGLDLHLIQPPGPVPPLPIPHPFIGMLFDPSEMAPFIGASVWVNGMPKATAGSEGKAVPPHIPIGGVFVPPPPGNECEMFMGSATVLFEDEPASYTALPALSCQSVGMPAPFRPKKKPKPIMKLPLSVVFPIPAGPPVLIGGPPTISMNMVMAKLKAAVKGAALKKLKKLMKKSKRIKKLSNKIHKAAEKAMKKLKVPGSIRNKVHKQICSVTGHPVDVATGKLFTENVDFELPGPIPLEWSRTWFSTSGYMGPLGHGWHHSYDLAFCEEGRYAAVRMPDGRPAGFPRLAPGGSHYDRAEKATLRRDDKGYAYTPEDGFSYRFASIPLADGTCPLASIEDKDGHRVVFHRDELGRLIGIVDSVGRTLRCTQDSQGRIASIELFNRAQPTRTLPLIRYRYDELGNLAEAVDPLGKSWRWIYRDRLIVKETDRNGLNWHFTWAGAGTDALCTRTWGDGGLYDHKLTYDRVKRVTVVENSLGHKTTYHYNPDGVVEKAVDPLGGVHLTGLTDFNEIALETDPLGNETRYTYDDRGNLLLVERPDGSKVETAYDAEDRPIYTVDEAGGKWTWEFDAAGHPVRKTDPVGAAISFTHSEGLVDSITWPGGAVATFAYDGHCNLIRATGVDGSTRTFEYDALGRCKAEIDPLGNRRETAYDAAGNPVRVVQPDGDVVELAYDGEGNLTFAKDPRQETRFEYFGTGCIKARHQGGRTVRFEYDTEERLTAILNEHGAAYRYAYDPAGEVASEVSFGGRTRTFVRDAKGRAVRMVLPGGMEKTLAWDPCDRLLEEAYGPKGEAGRLSFTWRADEFLLTADNGTAKLAYELDAMGRTLKETVGKHWVASEYDLLGRRTAIRSSLGAGQRIQHDAVGRAAKVTAGRGAGPEGFKPEWEVRFERDALGQEILRELPGGIKSTWERDKLGRPVSHRIRGGTTDRDRGYAWEPGDRLRRLLDPKGKSREFGYDEFDALAWSSSGPEFVLRVPDAIGNLYRSGERDDRAYGPGGELLWAKTKEGIATYAYDEAGNLARKEVRKEGAAEAKIWTYHWNAFGYLERVVRPDGREVRFTYDPMGRRLTKTFVEKTTYWVWDGDNPLHEWVAEKKPAPDAASSAPASPAAAAVQDALLAAQPAQGPPTFAGTADSPLTWLFEPGSFAPMALLAGENRYSILTDHLGAPVAMADAEGRESWSADLDLYGARVSGTGHASLCPFRFPGQYEDAETGLHYNRHRYYDPDAGLYISEDPIGLEGTGFNLRAYVRDPLTQFDPFGLECWNSARKKYWKKEAKRNPGKYSKANLARMKDGKAPRMRVVVTDRVTGKKKTKDVSMELHHKKIPQRVGGKDVHKASNLKKVTPWEHAEEDEFRHAGDPLHHVVNGVDTWKP